MFRPCLATFLLLALSFLSPADAKAHAIVIDSAPKAGMTLDGGPFEIAIRFNNRIDAVRSSLVILDAARAPIPVSMLAVVQPDELRATAPPLTGGRYRLRWQVLALDGHITRGDIPFTVKP